VLTYFGQAILHAIIAAGVIEALLRVWRIEPPGARLAFRLLALALPLIELPIFAMFASTRSDPWFAEHWALFSLAEWHELRLSGIGLDVVALAALALLGLSLYLLDFLPALGTWLVDRALPQDDEPAVRSRISSDIDRISLQLGQKAPLLRLVRSSMPVLLCAGLTQPRLVVSTGAAAALNNQEMRAALAHELTHARYRDPLLGWLLVVMRTIFFFSPASQIVARAAVEEVERRADDSAVRLTGDPLGMAGALVRLFAAEHAGAAAALTPDRAIAGKVASWLHLGRAAAVERRCRRLLSPHAVRPLPYWPLPLFLAGFPLMVLLFFVV
jgi:Zn-dependent protease with chaperone function